MPFQVSYSLNSIPPGEIHFFSAGDDQVTVCDTSVTLTAIVVGDLLGHTVVWEQLTGPAVTFTSPVDQLIVTYDIASFEDRSFRFYIDKGKYAQQSDDVHVYGAPTFSHYSGIPASVGAITLGNEFGSDVPVIRVLDAFPDTPQSVAETGLSSNPKLFWDIPERVDTIVQYVVQERSVAGPWTDEAILPPLTQMYTPLNVGSTYRVVAVRLEQNGIASSTKSNSAYVDNTVGTTSYPAGAASSAYSLGSGQTTDKQIQVPSYSVHLITLLSCYPDAPDEYHLGGMGDQSHITIPTFDVNVWTLTYQEPDAPDDYYLSSGQGTQTHITIPSYDVLDLEGGDIGG